MSSKKTIKVDSGIAVPDDKAAIAPYIHALAESKAREPSVLIPFANATSVGVTAQRILGKGNYTLRSEEDGVRVWRT